jgi:hypothetical protein
MMPMLRVRAALGTAVLSILLPLARCEAGAGRIDGEVRRLLPGSAAASAATDDSVTVMFQMTGMLLVTPPTQPDQPTQVLLPHVEMEPHSAVLGFGLEVDQPDLCTPFQYGTCWVDLDKFRPIGLGTGGFPSDMSRLVLPAGVLSVTDGSGGRYRVDPAGAGAEMRAKVDFFAGLPDDEETCRLAEWTYAPVDVQGQVQAARAHELVNAMNWKIRYPRTQPLALRFIELASGDTVEAPVRALFADTAQILLANIPTTELEELLNHHRGMTVSSVLPQTLWHFNEYYDLLREPGTRARVPATHRPLPASPKMLSRGACPLRITRFEADSVAEGYLDPAGGLKTYACVVGTGGG